MIQNPKNKIKCVELIKYCEFVNLAQEIKFVKIIQKLVTVLMTQSFQMCNNPIPDHHLRCSHNDTFARSTLEEQTPPRRQDPIV